MSAKQVKFGSRPAAKPEIAADPDQWVESRTVVEAPEEAPPQEKQKRMTFDVPEGLHRRVKAGCAARGVTIREVILALLEREFPPV